MKTLGGSFFAMSAQDSDELKLAAGSYSRRVAEEPEGEEDGFGFIHRRLHGAHLVIFSVVSSQM